MGFHATSWGSIRRVGTTSVDERCTATDRHLYAGDWMLEGRLVKHSQILLLSQADGCGKLSLSPRSPLAVGWCEWSASAFGRRASVAVHTQAPSDTPPSTGGPSAARVVNSVGCRPSVHLYITWPAIPTLGILRPVRDRACQWRSSCVHSVDALWPGSHRPSYRTSDGYDCGSCRETASRSWVPHTRAPCAAPQR
jgi:hypothetical protein